MADDAYRVRVAERLTDPMVRRFWAEEYAGYDRRFRAEAIAPIQNKVGQLLMSPLLRNILGQARGALDPGFLMDHRRILIANLAKGRLGEDKASLLGSLLVTSLFLAAAGRADVPETERADFYLYADEFQSFATDSFATMLSEARKYRLCLTLFHQFEDQLSEPVRAAIFGNVGTLLAFRVGQRDAEHLAAELEHELAPAELVALDRFEIAARLLEQGRQSVPFRARTRLPDARRHGRRANLIRQSRMRFGRPRAKVEREIDRITGWGG